MGRILLVNHDSTETCSNSPSHDESTGERQLDGFSIGIGDRFDLTAVLESIEKKLILRTLHATNGAQAEAARRMGLSRSALAYKLTKYGIRAEDGIVTEDACREHQSISSV